MGIDNYPAGSHNSPGRKSGRLAQPLGVPRTMLHLTHGGASADPHTDMRSVPLTRRQAVYVARLLQAILLDDRMRAELETYGAASVAHVQAAARAIHTVFGDPLAQGDRVEETPDGFDAIVGGVRFGSWTTFALAKAGLRVEQQRRARRTDPLAPEATRGTAGSSPSAAGEPAR